MKVIIYLFIASFIFKDYYSKNLKQKGINSNAEDKLLFVWQHFRHGARGPYIGIDPKTYLDFLGEKWEGIGELTPLGMRMLYLLGISTKKKYSNFLSKSYNPNELYITSTNVNRTILSVTSFLKGFYDNFSSINLTKTQINRGQILNTNYSESISSKIKELENYSIQNGESMIPVHIFDRSKLEFGLYEIGSCPGIDKYKKNNQNRQEVINIYEEIIRHTNDTFGEYIYKFMNVTNDTKYLWNKTNNYYLADTFFSNYFNGKEMNNIKETGINMEEFYLNSLNVTYIDTYYSEFGIPSTDTVYISVSPILTNMLNYIDLRIKLDKENKPDEIIPNSPRFVILSGHDTSMAPIDIFMQSEFGVEFSMANYAYNQIFELWKNSTTGRYSIHYLYNQELKDVFDYESFKDKIFSKIYTPSQIREICYPSTTKSFATNKKK
jgi:hypothetical protein